jgi:hypothetical protein
MAEELRITGSAIPPAFASPAARLGVAAIAGYVVIGGIAYRAVGDASYWARLLQPQFFLAIPGGLLLSLPLVLMHIRRTLRDESGGPITATLPAWRRAWNELSTERVLYVVSVALLAALFLNTFLAWKNLIPAVHPFAFDERLAYWSFALHAGPPYRLLTWLPVWLIDPLYYYGWTIGLIVGILAFAWAHDTKALLALLLCWILLGTVVAMLVSSAGPPYFSAVTGSASPYGHLFAWLATANRGQPAFALQVQRSLWVVHQRASVVSGTGISAFPSMHVATAMMFTLAARARWLRAILAIYTLLILLGSIELGWHYALDGYGAIFGSLCVWWLTGEIIRRIDRDNTRWSERGAECSSAAQTVEDA